MDTATQLREQIKVALLREPLKPYKRSPALKNNNTETKTNSDFIVVNILKNRHSKNGDPIKTNQIRVTDENFGDETNRKGEETKQYDGLTGMAARHLLRKRRNETRSETPDSAVISPITIYSDESEENVCSLEYMITQVYRPWIKHQINVVDILPFLPLEESDRCEIKSKNKSCPPDAVDHLLNILADRNIPGKWQTFIDALKSQEYTHLSKLLKNETEVHHKYSSNILKLVTNDIAKRICFQDFMLRVFGKGLITSAEREEADAVFKMKGPEAAARVILEYVDKHLPDWNIVLTDILKQSYMSDIAELFEMIERQPSPVQQKPGMRDDLNSEPASRQSPFRGRRVQYFDDNASEQQQTFTLSYDHNKPVEVIEAKDFNDLCIAVSEIQTDVKTLLKDVHQLKQLNKDVLLRPR